MADAMQGIMGLPQAPTGQDPAAQETINPEFFSPVIESYARNNPVQFGNDMLESMAAADPQMVKRFRDYLSKVQLPEEVLDAMGQLVDLVLGNPERYDEVRKDLLSEGVPAELLPEEFDLAFFAALNIALDQISGSQSSAPMQLAKGGIATLSPIALEIARMGRGEDKMLAHITPGEARMLRRRGGRGSINPNTGLVEYGLFSSIGKAIGGVFKSIGNAVSGLVKGVGNLVKEVASSTIGKIVLTAAAVYFLGPAGLNFAGSIGLTGSLAVGVNTFAASTLVGLAGGQSLGQALKTGAIAGVTAGFGSAIFGPPPGYEGAAGTPKPLPEVIDKSFPAGGVPPGSTPGVGATAPTVSAVPDPTGQIVRTDISGASPGAVARNAADVVTPSDVTRNALDTTRAATTQVSPPAQAFPVQPQPATVSTPLSNTAVSTVPTVNAAPSVAPVNVPAVEVVAPVSAAPAVAPAAAAQPVGIETVRAVTGNAAQAVAPAAAQTAAPAAAQAATQTAAPGVWESLKQGNFTDAAKAAWSNISPSQIQERGVGEAISAVQKQFPGVTQEQIINAPAGSVLSQAYKAALPGIVSTYGPLALAGLGAMTLTGGFKREQPEPPPGFSGPTGIDLLKSNPQTYGLSYGGTRTSYALNPYDYMYQPPFKAATGGIASLDRYAHGGQPSHFPRKTGPINGPGTGTSDSIPAMLSDGEFVFTAKAVRGAGNGSRRAGAKKMYALMKALERKA